MSWINDYKNVGRMIALMLLPVAIMGPWIYQADGAPPAAWCHDPFILLENGRCVGPVSGATVLTFMAGAFLSMSVGLVTGTTVLPDRTREFLGVSLFTMFLFLLMLPFLTTLLLIRGRDSRRWRAFHLMAWGLAAVLSLLPVAFDPVLRSGRFWGLWLYAGLAASALMLEVLALVAGRRSSQG